MDVAKIQLEIIDFQENFSLKQAFCNGTPETFRVSRVSKVNFPALLISSSNSNNAWPTHSCESAFSTMNFVNILTAMSIIFA